MNPHLQKTYDAFFLEPTVEKFRALQYFHGKEHKDLRLLYWQIKETYGYGGDLTPEEKKSLVSTQKRVLYSPLAKIKIKDVRDIWTLYSVTGNKIYINRVNFLKDNHPKDDIRMICEFSLCDFSSRGLI